MSKEVNFSPRAKLAKGRDIVANSVKISIGPKGRNVGIEQGSTPIIANDAGIISKHITLSDPIMNMGASIVKDVIQKTGEEVGAGRTAAAILTQAISREASKYVDRGMNFNLLETGMKEAVTDITNELKDISRPVTTKEEIQQIATLSTENTELGSVIADVIDKVGKDCVVTVEESQTLGVTAEIVEGMKFDKGWISPYMVTNPDRMEAVYTDTAILVTDKKISYYKDLYPVIKSCVDSGKNSLILICEDLDGEALNNSIMLRMMRPSAFNLLALKIPGFSDKKEWLEDICLATGAQLATEVTGTTIHSARLGMVSKIIAKEKSTVLMGSQSLKDKIEELKTLKETTQIPYEKAKLENRIAILSGSVAIIRVGAAIESDLKYLKLKIEDGVNESKRALEEGIIPGGDVAFINAAKNLTLKGKKWYEFWKKNTEEELGYNIVLKSIHLPLEQIILNCYRKPKSILKKIRASNSATIGYNALTNQIVPDMFEAGIIDAVKVSRTVLHKATIGAAKLLTLEVTITEEQEKESVKSNLDY